MSTKKNFTTIHEACLLWERLRPKSATKEEKAAVAGQIAERVRVGARLCLCWSWGVWAAQGAAAVGSPRRTRSRGNSGDDDLPPPPC